MKVLAFLVSVLLTVTTYSQNTINNYKYVLVPERFDFFKTDNQYGLNYLTKMLLEDKGFITYMGNGEIPPQIAANMCHVLKAEVTERRTLFVTNLTLALKDCQGNVLFKSKEGKSREKEFQPAYEEALRDAFSALKNTPYKYDSTAAVSTQPVMAPTPPVTAPLPPATNVTAAESTGVLYAQATANGYQLIDTTPKKVLTLLKTSQSDYFIADNGVSNGIVFKKNDEWFFESYKDGKLISQKLNIKF